MRLISDKPFLYSDFDLPKRAAGSEEDEHLATLIFNEFKKQSMAPWTDEHYVQLQTPNRFDANFLLALGKGFLKASVCLFAANAPTASPLVQQTSTLKATWPTALQEESQSVKP